MHDEGEKNCVDQRSWRRLRNKIHGTTRVHATWFARCYEIIPLLLALLPLPLFLSLSLSRVVFHRRLAGNRLLSPRPFVIFGKKEERVEFAATKKRFNRDFFDLSSLRTATLGTVYVCILLTSFPCNDENAFAGSKGMLLRESSPF